MAVQIGAPKQSGFDDPVGMLKDCHRRIERFASVLVKVGDLAQGGELTGEQSAALEGALNYFETSAPRHTADEEESLFPRMARSGAECEHTSGLELEHERMAALESSIQQLGRKWLESGRLSDADWSRYQETASEMETLYAGHIEVEESIVFPLADRVLGGQDKLEMGREMAHRRGLESTLSMELPLRK